MSSLVKYLPDSDIYCWDPVVTVDELKLLGYKSMASLKKVIEDSSAIILVNNHPELSSLNLKSISIAAKKPLLIYDFWGRSDHNFTLEGFGQYFSWGNHFIHDSSKG